MLWVAISAEYDEIRFGLVTMLTHTPLKKLLNSAVFTHAPVQTGRMVPPYDCLLFGQAMPCPSNDSDCFLDFTQHHGDMPCKSSSAPICLLLLSR